MTSASLLQLGVGMQIPLEKVPLAYANEPEKPDLAVTAGLEVMPAPGIFFLREPVEVDERRLIGRAGRHYSDMHPICTNLLYSAAVGTKAALLAAFHDSAAPELRDTAQRFAERIPALRTGVAVVYALANKPGCLAEHPSAAGTLA